MPYTPEERARLIEISDEVGNLNRRILEDSQTADLDELLKLRGRVNDLMRELDEIYLNANRRLPLG